MVALSVQFHHQLHDSLRTAEEIKRRRPETFVLMGGMTASFFARAILEQHPGVDAVVAGEGERPLAEVVAAVRDGRTGDLSAVPNLLWRRNGGIEVNPGRYVADQADLDAMDFENFALMDHAAEYERLPKILTRLNAPRGLAWRLSKALSQHARVTVHTLVMGRGCVTHCSYCGGGATAHRVVNGRTQVLFRSLDNAVGAFGKLAAAGFRGAYISFDPMPASQTYYPALFERLRRDGLRTRLIFSAWAIPSLAFLEGFAAAFEPGSRILLSPETGSERLRRTVRGIWYSNDDLLAALRRMDDLGIATEVCFSLGLPGETRADFDATLRLKDTVERSFGRASVSAFPIEIEPAAPWFLHPDRFGITLLRRTLSDFLAEQRKPGYSSMANLGYWQDRYLDQPVAGPKAFARKVLATKCRHFCGQRAICAAASAAWAAADALRLSRCGDEPV